MPQPATLEMTMGPNQPDTDTASRRSFLGVIAGTAVALAAGAKPAWARIQRVTRRVEHPEPRPGIDASNVLTPDQLADAPNAIPIYDKVRQIPEIADGIYCHCGCAELPGYRSLLICYEEKGMAKYCVICQGEGNLAYRLHESGKSLDQIRAAIDARFG